MASRKREIIGRRENSQGLGGTAGKPAAVTATRYAATADQATGITDLTAVAVAQAQTGRRQDVCKAAIARGIGIGIGVRAQRGRSHCDGDDENSQGAQK
jgi:hypothetical protein